MVGADDHPLLGVLIEIPTDLGGRFPVYQIAHSASFKLYEDLYLPVTFSLANLHALQHCSLDLHVSGL